jgi:hypothetical protein
MQKKPQNTPPFVTATTGNVFIKRFIGKGEVNFGHFQWQNVRCPCYGHLLLICLFKGLCECFEERPLIDIVDVNIGNDSFLVDYEEGPLGYPF